MESVLEFISSILMKIFPAEIAYGIIIMGFMIFFLCFYGNKEWKSFSDLEKIIFSISTGALFWFLFIFPLAMGYETLKLIYTYTDDLNVVNKSINNFYYIATSVVLIFIFARILSKTPLFYNNIFLKLGIHLTGFSVFVMFCLFIFFKLFPFYSPLIQKPLGTSTFFLMILYVILLKLSNPNFIFESFSFESDKIKKYFKYAIFALIFLFSIIAISITTNYVFENPTISDKKMKIVRLEIPILPVEKNSYGNLTGSRLVEDRFELKFSWVKWAYVPENFTITGGSTDKDSSEVYNFYRNDAILRGDKKVNVTLIGNQKITVDKDFYSLEKEYIDNGQIWNISFNRMDYEIDINEIVVNPPQNFKLASYKNYGLSINKERLDEKLNESTNLFTINNVQIPKYYNDGTNIYKISLYFIENK